MNYSTEYINGFNDGYTVRKTHPLLFRKIVKGTSISSPYLKGFKDGGTQYKLELKASLLHMKKRHIEKNNKDKGLEI